MKVMRKMPSWKALGTDNVQGYWLDNLTPLHKKLAVYFIYIYICMYVCMYIYIYIKQKKK